MVLICIYVVKHVDGPCDYYYIVVGLFELIGMGWHVLTFEKA
jgi:hypothetical protein